MAAKLLSVTPTIRRSGSQRLSWSSICRRIVETDDDGAGGDKCVDPAAAASCVRSNDLSSGFDSARDGEVRILIEPDDTQRSGDSATSGSQNSAEDEYQHMLLGWCGEALPERQHPSCESV